MAESCILLTVACGFFWGVRRQKSSPEGDMFPNLLLDKQMLKCLEEGKEYNLEMFNSDINRVKDLKN